MKLIKVEKIKRPDSRLLGIATIELDNGYVMHDIKIVKSDKGLTINPPIISKDVEEMSEQEKYFTSVLNNENSKQKMKKMIINDFKEL